MSLEEEFYFLGTRSLIDIWKKTNNMHLWDQWLILELLWLWVKTNQNPQCASEHPTTFKQNFQFSLPQGFRLDGSLYKTLLEANLNTT